MDIRVNFTNTAQRDAFANRWNLTIPDGVDHLDVPWHLAHHAINDASATSHSQLDTEEQEFLVVGDRTDIETLATVVQDLGSGWYLVKSTQGVELGKVVSSIELNSAPLKFVENVSTITSMNGTPATLDPESADGQWARIRVASQYRPLSTSFAVHDVKYASKPELYIMDTGINFSHDEFAYDGIEAVDFYTLPIFNGNYSDDVGHGTAVASMAVGKNLGVARYAKVMNVKIGGKVDGETHAANLLEVGYAIDAIIAEIAKDPMKSRVVNMSWGVARSAWLDSKVQSLLDAGATVIAAAGNSSISVEDVSPAGLDTVITVGAIDKYDIPAGFNNISPSDSGLTTSTGLSLDLFAPGDNVMIADFNAPNGYVISSGTSFSAPLVAGVALEIAGMNSEPVFYNNMKSIIMDTATENALLFEDDRFSDNQNRLVYLITTDNLAAYKQSESVSYLGVHNEDDTIVADLNSSLNTTLFKNTYPNDTLTFSVEMLPDSVDYAQFVTCDPVTGLVTIDKPNLPLPEETRLKMVNFIGVAESSRVRMTSNTIFFFVSNPLYADTLHSDVTLALTDINSISFFATWTNSLK
jgi:hypothetical protein